MKFLSIFGIFIIFTVTVIAQDDGRYRPAAIRDNDGRYRPGNDGRYIPGDDGKYTHIGDGDRGLYKSSPTPPTTRLYTRPIVTSRPSITTIRPIISTSSSRPIPTAPTTTLQPRRYGNGVYEGGGGWKIIRQEQKSNDDGYQYLFETENGILAEESGRIENRGLDNEGLRSVGFYEYTGDDGVLYRVDYTADENGFVPQGDHIPKTPPEIQRLLAYLAANPEKTKK